MNNREMKRKEIVEKGSMYLLKNGLYEFSLRPFARFLGTSDRMLLHYFEDKEELLYQILSNLMEKTILALKNKESEKKTIAEFFTALPEMLAADSSRRFFRIWLELCSYKDSRLNLTEEFIAGIFAMFGDWLDSMVDFEDVKRKAETVAFLIIYIEGCIVVSSYDRIDLVRSASGWISRMVPEQIRIP